MSSVPAIPEGYHSLTPYLNIHGADELIEFLQEAFGASQLHRHDRPDGTLMHAELRVGDSMLMLSEACNEMPPMPSCLFLYVDDADATYARALAAGAESVMEPADMFWGDRFAMAKDPSGNMWSIATHIEDVSAEELARRAKAYEDQSKPEA